MLTKIKKIRRNYQNQYPSVTEILNIMANKGLEWWWKNNTLEFCERESKIGRESGTDVHDALEHHILGEKVEIKTKYPSQVTNALKGFMQFKKEHPEVEFNFSEMMITSKTYKYNGTIDILGKVEGELALGDFKTGKCIKKNKDGTIKKKLDEPTIYLSHRVQISAYIYAYNELNEEKIKRAFILSLAKDKVAYNYEEIPITDIHEMFQKVFVPALSICNYQREHK